jgi:hypothetical protein
MALGPAGQKQRRGKGISIRRGHRDIVAKYVVQPRLGHRVLLPAFASGHGKSEIGFCRKGLSGLPEI